MITMIDTGSAAAAAPRITNNPPVALRIQSGGTG